MTMPLLLTEECAISTRAMTPAEQGALTELLAAAVRRPGSPPPGAVGVAGKPGWVWTAPGGRRLYFSPSSDGALQLFAMRNTAPGAPALPELNLGLVTEFLRHGLAVLEPSGPARPATDVEAAARDSRARPIETLSALAFIEDDVLVQMGVPPSLLQAVRQCEDAEMIEALGLPASVVASLRGCLAPQAPEDVAFIPDVLKYRVPDLETLRRYYLGDVRRLLLNVTPEQQQLIDLDVDTPLQVNGVAGSGKTTVALYRIRRRLEQVDAFHTPRLLYLSYNKTLALAAQELLKELIGDLHRAVEVRTLHSWASYYLRSKGVSIDLADDGVKAGLIRAAVAALRAHNLNSALLERETDFWIEEISQVVKGRCRNDREEYMRVERTGRGTNLTAAGRELVWKVFEHYQNGLRAIGKNDYEDMLLRALGLLELDKDFEPYDEVLVDEAQDLSRSALMLCARLVHRDRPRLTVFADATQRIYQHGFRWKDVGLSTRSRLAKLARNFRGTREILALANSVIGSADLDADADVLAAVDSGRHGPKPRFLMVSSFADENWPVAKEIAKLARDGAVNLGNIAVLARSGDRLARIGHALKTLGVPARHFRDEALVLGDPCVKLITLHSSKGLEFPLVYIVGANEGELPKIADGLPPEEREAKVAAERRLLYVGITRASQDLCIVHMNGFRSSLFSDAVDLLTETVRIK